ncbi:DUF4145 domain-containing protein [Streptomyces sp. DSM 41527]|uniref:DUF4145 domain-containing protein n=1 Tax=Streptomyces mooreae TaxID=3075523 RepID=A0ABU2TC80_9ACTN|nr:DUF4145 domain-containing protein [Streptomyces sp. DSM 41527]MDT0458554.1 DUF4145 domain-containing protein [Streptomyces sp. DSM 41527]
MARMSRVGITHPLICPHCEKPTLATVSSEATGGGEMEPPYLLELATCGTCHDPFLMIEEDWGGGWDGEPLVVWPKQQRTLSTNVPEALRREHEEARQCFSSKAYTATAVMVRRTLEGVCLDQGMSSGGRPKPLFKMLEQMKDEGKIDGQLFEWAQELRVLGNQGAHFTFTSVSREDAADGLALAEALLDYLYVFSAQFTAFKARRAAKAAESSAQGPPGKDRATSVPDQAGTHGE